MPAKARVDIRTLLLRFYFLFFFGCLILLDNVTKCHFFVSVKLGSHLLVLTLAPEMNGFSSGERAISSKKKSIFSEKKDISFEKKDIFSEKKDISSEKKGNFPEKKDVSSGERTISSEEKGISSREGAISSEKKGIFFDDGMVRVLRRLYT